MERSPSEPDEVTTLLQMSPDQARGRRCGDEGDGLYGSSHMLGTSAPDLDDTRD